MMNVIAFVLCSTGAVIKAIERDWGYVAIDTALAVLNAGYAYDWLKS